MEKFNRKDFMLELNQAKRLETKEFILKAKQIYGDRFDYSETEYINARTKLKIICKLHGEHLLLPHHHLNGTAGGGCPQCGKSSINDNKRLTQQQFIERIKDIKGLSFEKTIYIDKRKKVIVTCKIHGDYETSAEILLKGHGCPKCVSSNGENKIEIILKKLNISFKPQKTFKGLVYVRSLRFDFYLPDYNSCIEFDGEQHFKCVSYWGGEKGFKDLQIKDALKVAYCQVNNISLLRIRFDESDIESAIRGFLKL